jgi:hypothetical protein
MTSAVIADMRGLLTLICLSMMTGCSGKSPATPSPVSRDVTLAPGQTVNLSEAAISLHFEGVTGDSRCPADALRIQGGDALVRIEVIPVNGRRQPYDLHTGDMKPVRHGDLTISLVELSPYPFSSHPISPGDYRATLRVVR